MVRGEYPKVRISHLESRMRQSGDYQDDEPLTPDRLQHLLRQAIEDLDVEQARRQVAPFTVDPRVLDVWSQDFFRQIIPRIISI